MNHVPLTSPTNDLPPVNTGITHQDLDTPLGASYSRQLFTDATNNAPSPSNSSRSSLSAGSPVNHVPLTSPSNDLPPINTGMTHQELDISSRTYSRQSTPTNSSSTTPNFISSPRTQSDIAMTHAAMQSPEMTEAFINRGGIMNQALTEDNHNSSQSARNTLSGGA